MLLDHPNTYQKKQAPPCTLIVQDGAYLIPWCLSVCLSLVGTFHTSGLCRTPVSGTAIRMAVCPLFFLHSDECIHTVIAGTCGADLGVSPGFVRHVELRFAAVQACVDYIDKLFHVLLLSPVYPIGQACGYFVQC